MIEPLKTDADVMLNDVSEIWKQCLTIVKAYVPAMTFNTWIKPIKPISYDNNTFTIQLPGSFFYEWIDEHYSSLIRGSLEEVVQSKIVLDYIIVEESNEPVEDQNEDVSNQPEPPKEDTTPVIGLVDHDFEANLNPRYTFDNFIKGEGNQLARAAAVAISENPGGTSFNPLFIYGGVGLGKTHLMQAIGNSIVEKYPRKRILYISSDKFTVDFVDAIQSHKINEFGNFYRSMDVLIIDDIQFLIGKERTQDLFFHIFNSLHQSGRQLILSSDKPPKDLKGMDERLISRFHWGLTADIQPPELETRIAILNRKSEDYGITVSSDILEYIASHITSNIRELEGCLIKLLANASLRNKEISLDLAKKAVKEISTTKKTNISIDIISKIVCDYLGVDEKKIRDKSRKQEIVTARQISMYLSKQMTKSSLKTIGLHFGGRDHSTVIHACSTVETTLTENANYKETVERIKDKIELACS